MSNFKDIFQSHQQVTPSTNSDNVTSSKFLDKLYNDPVKYKAFKGVVKDMMEQTDKLRVEREDMSVYVIPLGFSKPMLLVDSEEKVINTAILAMAHSINEGQYILADKTIIEQIEVAEHKEKDMPFNRMTLRVRCLISNAPDKGFYMRGIFKKERVMREIVSAKIDRIVYFTKDNREIVLLKFTATAPQDLAMAS
jgi:hypothetical protein